MTVDRMCIDGSPLGAVLPQITDSLRRNWMVLSLALALNLGDMITTHLGLTHGLQEGNPVPAMLHASGGEFALFGAKFAVLTATIFVICLLGRRYHKLWHTFTVTNVVLLAAVISNSAQILAH